MPRYSLDPTGLHQLTADLSSPEVSRRRRALRALRWDPDLRDVVTLVATTFQLADEQIAKGDFTGDSVQLNRLRPIAGILPRLGELSGDADPGVHGAATAALRQFKASPPAYSRRRLAWWWTHPMTLTGAAAIAAAVAALLTLIVNSSFWLVFSLYDHNRAGHH